MKKALICLFILNSVFAIAKTEELLSADVQLNLRNNILDPIKPHLVFNNKEKADAWLNDMSNRLSRWVHDDYLRRGYLTIIQYEAMRAGLDPQLVLSIITVESKFNNFALSGAGAIGLMQIMPFWQIQIGTPEQSLYDAQTNLRYGCTILRYYLARENGNIERALARYNGSIGKAWYPELVKEAYNTYWQPSTVMTMKNGKVVYIDYTN